MSDTSKIQVGDVWLNADGYEVRIAPGEGKERFDAVRVDGDGVHSVNSKGRSGMWNNDLVRLVSRAGENAKRFTPEEQEAGMRDRVIAKERQREYEAEHGIPLPTLGQSLTSEERAVAAERAAHAPGKPPIQAGDVWADGKGQEFTISPNSNKFYPWLGRCDDESFMFTSDGHWLAGKDSRPYDLVRLVRRATPPKADTIPCPPPEHSEAVEDAMTGTPAPKPMPEIEQCLGRQVRTEPTRGPMGPEARAAFEAPPSLDLQQRLEQAEKRGRATMLALTQVNTFRNHACELYDELAQAIVGVMAPSDDPPDWYRARAKIARNLELRLTGRDEITTGLFSQCSWWAGLKWWRG